GYRVLLHGDVHEQHDHLLNHLDPDQRIHIVGGGTFGAVAKDRPESTPRLSSLLEVANRHFSSPPQGQAPARVRARQVESRLGASTDAEVPPRFPAPLVKPDVPISGIRLSDCLLRRLTNARPSAPAAGPRPESRTPVPPGTGWCLAMTPCDAVSGSAARCRRRTRRPPDKPSPCFRNRSTLASLAASDSAAPALRSTVFH